MNTYYLEDSMITETYTINKEVMTDYTGWPILCINCGSDQVIYSSHKDDVRCIACGCWQLNEEEQDGKGN